MDRLKDIFSVFILNSSSCSILYRKRQEARKLASYEMFILKGRTSVFEISSTITADFPKYDHMGWPVAPNQIQMVSNISSVQI